MKCTDCIHFEICCYVDPNLPVCDSFMHKDCVLKLPCPLGSTVYMVVSGYDTYDNIAFKKVIEVPFRLDVIKSIGKRVFLTREEAEKKLEELK